jgi:S1-C subfamily serine protease
MTPSSAQSDPAGLARYPWAFVVAFLVWVATISLSGFLADKVYKISDPDSVLRVVLPVCIYLLAGFNSIFFGSSGFPGHKRGFAAVVLLMPFLGFLLLGMTATATGWPLLTKLLPVLGGGAAVAGRFLQQRSNLSGRLIVGGFFAGLLAVAVVGFVILQRIESWFIPTDQVRHAAFKRYQSLFTGNQTNALNQIYTVISGLNLNAGQFRSRSDGIYFAGTNESVNIGMAIGLEPDGYLLTATHVLRGNTVVIGSFNGKLDIKPARVVFKSDSKTHADVALLKVDAHLYRQAVFGRKPQVRDRVFAVVSDYVTESNCEGYASFTAGKVLEVTRDPGGSAVDLVYTDVPFRAGDSGGALLSSNGELIGVDTAFTCGPPWLGYSSWADLPPRQMSFLPDKQFVQNIIAEDRANHPAPNAP